MAGFGQNFLFGVPSSYQQIPKFSQEGMDALSQLLKSSSANLQNPTQGFEPIKQRALSQYQQQTIPQLAERFAGQNATASSGFQGALGGAGTDLAERLASLESEYGLANRRQSLSEFQTGVTPQFENLPIGGQQGYLEQILPSLIEAAPGIISAFGGNVPGAVASLLPLMMKLFKGGRSPEQAESNYYKQKQQSGEPNPFGELTGSETAMSPWMYELSKLNPFGGGEGEVDKWGRRIVNGKAV